MYIIYNRQNNIIYKVLMVVTFQEFHIILGIYSYVTQGAEDTFSFRFDGWMVEVIREVGIVKDYCLIQ